MAMLHPVDTFVIRLWSPADHAADTGDSPRGVARHVGTGRAAAFRDADELIALLPRTHLPTPIRNQPRVGVGSVLRSTWSASSGGHGMRILVIGAGGVGSAAIGIADRRAFFEHLVVADYDP